MTRDDVEKLKRNWEADPCYDLEDAEGFEEFREELVAHRIKMEQRWEANRLARLDKKAEQLGAPGNRLLAQYIDSLEYRLKQLEARIDA